METLSKTILLFFSFFVNNDVTIGQKIDTSKINSLNLMACDLRNTNPDSCVLMAKQAVALSQKINYSLGEASGYLWEGTAITNQGHYDNAIKLITKSIQLFKGIKKGNKHVSALARAYNNLGNVYWYKGNYAEALKYHLRSLQIKETINDKQGIASSYNNIGNIHSHQGNFDQALKNYASSIKIHSSIANKKGVADLYNNIGLVYSYKKDFEKALENYHASLKISFELNDKSGISISYTNIGLCLEDQGKLDEAFESQLKAIKLKEGINDQYGISISFISIGSILLTQGKFNESKNYFEKGLHISNQLGSIEEIKASYEGLYKASLAQNNFNDALTYYKLYIAHNDSLTNQENTKKQTQLEMQYVFDKKQTADSIKNVEQAKQEMLKHEQEIKQQKIYTYGGIIGFALMLVVAVVSFRAFKNKQKANRIIAEQKLMVEEKQKEVLDSIHYAKRIQNALLPSQKYIERNLKSFQSKK